MGNLDFLLGVNRIKRSGIEYISTVSHRLKKWETKLNEATQWIDSLGLRCHQSLVYTISSLRSKNKTSHLNLSLLIIPKKKKNHFCSYMETAAKITGSYIKMTTGKQGSKASPCKFNNGKLKQKCSREQTHIELETTRKGNPHTCGMENILTLFCSIT